MKRTLLIGVVLALALVLIVGNLSATAQSGNTWRADYFSNPDWAGAPVMTQQLSFISLDWGFGSPSPVVPADNFTARFTTDAFFYAGAYTFSVVADDEFVLIVDGAPFLDTRGHGMSGKPTTFTASMPQGTRRIEVLYREWSQTAYIFVNWAIGTGGVAPNPSPQAPPLPPNQATIQTQFGNYTACMQQNIHQSNCFVSDGAWDSPNAGSIQMERQIQSWVNCSPADQVSTFFVSTQFPAEQYVCSRTLAGWFPR